MYPLIITKGIVIKVVFVNQKDFFYFVSLDR